MTENVATHFRGGHDDTLRVRGRDETGRIFITSVQRAGSSHYFFYCTHPKLRALVTPCETLHTDSSPNQNLPDVICSHGGTGTRRLFYCTHPKLRAFVAPCETLQLDGKKPSAFARDKCGCCGQYKNLRLADGASAFPKPRNQVSRLRHFLPWPRFSEPGDVYDEMRLVASL